MFLLFFFKQKTAYEMRISDWSSDVCSSDLPVPIFEKLAAAKVKWKHVTIIPTDDRLVPVDSPMSNVGMIARQFLPKGARVLPITAEAAADYRAAGKAADARLADRSEEHTSELQSLMRISYAVFCLKKKSNNTPTTIKQKPHTEYVNQQSEYS